MTKTEVMAEAELDEDEFDDLYANILVSVREHGTRGVQTMLNYLDQELTEGREFIE